MKNTDKSGHIALHQDSVSLASGKGFNAIALAIMCNHVMNSLHLRKWKDMQYYCKLLTQNILMNISYLYLGRSKPEGPQKLYWAALRMLALTGPHCTVSPRVLLPVSVFKTSPSCTPKLSMPWGARGKKVQKREENGGRSIDASKRVGWNENNKKDKVKKRKPCKKGARADQLEAQKAVGR